MATGAIEAGRAFVRILTDDSDFRRGLDRTRSYFTQWGAGISRLGKQMFLGGLGLAGGIEAATLTFQNMGAELARAAERTGIAVEQLSQLKYAAAQAGLDFDDLQRGLARMARNITEFEEGSDRGSKAFGILGLSAQSFLGLSPIEKFKLIADRISQITDPTTRAGIAMQIFGSSSGAAAAKLLNLLNQGKSGIDALMERANQLGLTISTDDAKAALELAQRFSDLWNVMKVGAFTIGGLFAPEVRTLVVLLTGAINAVRKFASEHKVLTQSIVTGVTIAAATLLALGGASLVFGRGLLIVGRLLGFGITAFKLFAGVGKTIFSALLTGIPAVISGIGSAITWVIEFASAFTALASVPGLIILGLIALGATIVAIGLAWENFKTDGKFSLFDFPGLKSELSSLATYWKEVWKNLKIETIEAFDGIRAALTSGDWGAAARIAGDYIKLEFDKAINAIESKLLHLAKFDWMEKLVWMEMNMSGMLLGLSDSEKAQIKAQMFPQDSVLAKAHATEIGQDTAQLYADAEAAKRAAPTNEPTWKNPFEEQGEKMEEDFDAAKAIVFGTFNPAALFGLGGKQDKEERQTKAAEQTAKNTKKIADNIGNIKKAVFQ
jgi:hypothetical protein